MGSLFRPRQNADAAAPEAAPSTPEGLLLQQLQREEPQLAEFLKLGHKMRSQTSGGVLRFELTSLRLFVVANQLALQHPEGQPGVRKALRSSLRQGRQAPRGQMEELLAEARKFPLGTMTVDQLAQNHELEKDEVRDLAPFFLVIDGYVRGTPPVNLEQKSPRRSAIINLAVLRMFDVGGETLMGRSAVGPMTDLLTEQLQSCLRQVREMHAG